MAGSATGDCAGVTHGLSIRLDAFYDRQEVLGTFSWDIQYSHVICIDTIFGNTLNVCALQGRLCFFY